MKSVEGNPERNKLGAGISDAELSELVAKSGYPLQILVERILSRNGLGTLQEWTYVDKQTNSERNLDILAERYFENPYENGKVKVFPVLDLLVQCKRSDLPYLFFLISDTQDWYDIPLCIGTRKEVIEMLVKGTKPVPVELHIALGLDTHPFAGGEVKRCMSFTKCVRNPKLTVMGEEPFNDIVLPLIKAAHHFKEVRVKAPKNAKVYDCRLVVCLAVIDAPIIAVSVNDDTNELIAMPWVRVSRNLVSKSDIYYGAEKEIFIDVVHKDYLETYLKSHLFPFAEQFKQRVLRHQSELFSCKGYVPDVEKKLDDGDDIESLLRPIGKPE